jgi:hypothetical protein
LQKKNYRLQNFLKQLNLKKEKQTTDKEKTIAAEVGYCDH